MTKAELIERTIDAMTDPWTDSPDDYLYSTSIDLHEATDLLDQIRSDEQDMDLEPDEQLPQEVTPEIVMEAYNCHVRAMKYEARTERLADWIKENNPVCEYCNYYLPEHEDAKDVMPIDFLANTDGFPFIEDASPLDILCIGMNRSVMGFSMLKTSPGSSCSMQNASATCSTGSSTTRMPSVFSDAQRRN